MSDEFIKIRYAAFSDYLFKGVIETEITKEEWAGMSEKEQNEAVEDYTVDLVDIWVEDE